MAALTETNRRDFIFGNCRVIVGTLTLSNATGDTWQPGLRQIVHVDMSPTTAQTVGYTSSAGTVTFQCGGTVTATVMVFGFD